MIKIKDSSILNDWFSSANQIFKVNELKNIKNLLIELDSTIDDVNQEKPNINNNQKQSLFLISFSKS